MYLHTGEVVTIVLWLRVCAVCMRAMHRISPASGSVLCETKNRRADSINLCSPTRQANPRSQLAVGQRNQCILIHCSYSHTYTHIR